jgi:hypothetical protein
VRYYVLKAASMNITVLWGVLLCSLVEMNRRFIGVYCLHHQDDETSANFFQTAWHNILDVSHHQMASCPRQEVHRNGGKSSYITTNMLSNRRMIRRKLRPHFTPGKESPSHIVFKAPRSSKPARTLWRRNKLLSLLGTEFRASIPWPVSLMAEKFQLSHHACHIHCLYCSRGVNLFREWK